MNLPAPSHYSIHIPPAPSANDFLRIATMAPVIVMAIAVLILVIVLAFGTYWDAKNIVRRKGKLFVFDSASWSFIVLLSGIFGFAIYWLAHHSRLRSHGLQPDETERVAKTGSIAWRG
ncbi:MAG: hypothetical protein HZA31_07025 [Opitutae bacterium]|nr:hypothetical protein [Opitutae bacterium]